MKSAVFIVFFGMVSLVQSQINIQRFANEIAKRRLPTTSVEHVKGTLYKLTNKVTKRSRVMNFGLYEQNKEASLHFATDSIMIITPWLLDTSLYNGKFVFWQDVDVDASWFTPPFIADVNHNKRCELYGMVTTPDKEVVKTEPVAVYEINNSGKFEKIFQFPYPRRDVLPQSVVDIDNDGIEELHVYGWDSLKTNPSGEGPYFQKDRFFKKLTDTSLATEFYFQYTNDSKGIQRDDPKWGDFDNDGIKEMVFSDRAVMNIAKYNLAKQYLDSVFSFSGDTFCIGYSINDFDNDGKTEFVMGSDYGDIRVVECEGKNTYRHVWTGKVTTLNAYNHFTTNDIDGNGKKEFWVEGHALYYDGFKTRLYGFESDGDNSYKQVSQMDILGIFSTSAGNGFGVDVDGDGKEEIFLCIDHNIFIFKFTGTPNHHSYSVLYHKLNDFAENASIVGATLYDVDNDGKLELLITYELSVSIDRGHSFTRIYKLQKPLSVTDHYQTIFPSQYNVSSNFPNPFNGSTTIQYRLPVQNNVTIKIYSILGKEIKTIFNQMQLPGNYRVTWDGKDEKGYDTASGIYFIKFQTNNYVQTIKSVLLK